MPNSNPAASKTGAIGLSRLSVGVVSYLNARPLTAGLEEECGLDLIRMEPSAVADCLLNGQVDIGLVPSVTLLESHQLTYLPGLCIGANGAVDSVFLFQNERLSDTGPIRVILDPASRTSQELTRIYLEEAREIPADRIQYTERDPRTALADRDGDFVLMIGDPALDPNRPSGWEIIDLAAAWKDMTGLPFVFAVWGLSSHTLADHSELTSIFAASLSRGLTHLDDEVAVHARRHQVAVEKASDYLRNRIVYTMGAAEEAGLKAFLDRVRRRRET